MALPNELLQFAENFYRRFPEEFLALGAPGLEDIYDLRPNSTLTRKIQESPSEKSVEITLRRWQQPPPQIGYGRMPHSFGYPQASASSTAGQYGYNYGMQSQPQYASYGMPPPSYGMPSHGHSMGPPPTAAPVEPPRWESELTARLARLEGALSSLKPQIEVLLTAPPPQQSYDHGRQAPPQASAFAGSSDDHTIHQNGKPAPSNPMSPSGANQPGSSKMTALGNRRGMTSLAIETAPKPQAAEKPFPAPAPIAQPPTKPAAQEVRGISPTAKNATIDLRKPAVSINPCRVAPGLQDPQSPRSPGLYSAWK